MSRKVAPEFINKVKQAMKRRFDSERNLAIQVGCARSTVTNFLNGKPVSKDYYDAISEKLCLDPNEIAYIEEPNNDLVIDALVEKVRKHCHNKIQILYGKMQLLDIAQPIDIDNLYVDVNILEKITSYQWQELSELVQGFNPTDDNFNRLGLGKVRQKRVPGLDAVTEHSRLMVLGKPGAGKTTFLKHIAIECNQGNFEANLIPIFIPLKIFAENARSSAEFCILQYIHQEFTSCGIAEQSVIETVLSQGRGLILLDGLDEVPEEYSDEVVRQIRSFAGKYFNNRFIITCRIAALNYRFQNDGFTDVEVADFNEQQIEDFAKNWFVAFSKNNQKKGLDLAYQFIEKLNSL